MASAVLLVDVSATNKGIIKKLDKEGLPNANPDRNRAVKIVQRYKVLESCLCVQTMLCHHSLLHAKISNHPESYSSQLWKDV